MDPALTSKKHEFQANGHEQWVFWHTRSKVSSYLKKTAAISYATVRFNLSLLSVTRTLYV